MLLRRSSPSFALALLGLLAVVGCDDGTPAPSGVTGRFDPTLSTGATSAERWLALPFPSDFRRDAAGHPIFADFPNPAGLPLLDTYLATASSTLDGFSLQAPVHFAFEGALDPDSFPASPEAYLDEAAPLALVDVTPGSPEAGARRPLRVRTYAIPDDVETTYVSRYTLAMGPAFGFPLREHTTYAAYVLDDVRTPEGSAPRAHPLLAALLSGATKAPRVEPPIDEATYARLRDVYAPLRDHLAASGLDPRRLVAATVFTTQTITRDLAAVHDQIANDLPAPSLAPDAFVAVGTGGAYSTAQSYRWNATDTVTYRLLEGRYVAPSYQEGALPYQDEGGALHFVDGVPTKTADETIRFVLSVPDAPPDPALGCYPIVEYAHGTGGNAYSMQADRTAARLAARGLAGISIDQPMHGLRAQGLSFDVEFLSFNFGNPDAFRSNFRQAAIDTFSLTRFVRESLVVPASASPTGQAIHFCPDRVAFFGHSHGGLSGALAAPFESSIDAFLLSGAGGAFSITMMDRKDYVDFAALITNAFRIPDTDEPLSLEHPVLMIFQTLADVSDPIHYAPYWNRLGGTRPSPASVMLTSGEHDAATPYRTAIVLAASGGLPVTNPVVVDAPELGWAGLSPLDTPLVGNANGRTLGFLQWTNDVALPDYDTHFVIFHRPEAIDAGHHFLETATKTLLPEIRRDPTSTAR